MKQKTAHPQRINRGPRVARAHPAAKSMSVARPRQPVHSGYRFAIDYSEAGASTRELLRQPSALVGSIVEHLPNMVFLKDAKELRFVYVNKAGEELLGYSRCHLLGRNTFDLFPKEQADLFPAMDREVLFCRNLVDIPEGSIQTRHKGVRVLHTKKMPICDAEGGPQYLLGISEDTTERKEAEKILLDAKADLERRVIERTAELSEVNAALQREIAERQAAAESLRDLSARLIHAQEEERSRIAREIHDDLSQQLALIGIELGQLRQRMRSSAGEHVALCEDLLQKVRQLSIDLRGLSHELHPSKLAHLGLVAAVRSLCGDIARLHKVEIECAVADVPKSLPRPVALCLYRIAQEALHNVVKHSGARHALVDISGLKGMITLTVSDSGRGFDLDSQEGKAGLGFISMNKRARMIGGTFSIQSMPSRGTKIEARVPRTPSALSQSPDGTDLCIDQES